MNDTELNLIELQVRLKVFAEEFTFRAERVAADPKLSHLEKKYRTDAERCAHFAEDIELFIIPRVQPQRNQKLPELLGGQHCRDGQRSGHRWSHLGRPKRQSRSHQR